jgi:hypothetical protein
VQQDDARSTGRAGVAVRSMGCHLLVARGHEARCSMTLDRGQQRDVGMPTDPVYEVDAAIDQECCDVVSDRWLRGHRAAKAIRLRMLPPSRIAGLRPKMVQT